MDHSVGKEIDKSLKGMGGRDSEYFGSIISTLGAGFVDHGCDRRWLIESGNVIVFSRPSLQVAY